MDDKTIDFLKSRGDVSMGKLKAILQYRKANGWKKTFQFYGKLLLGVPDYREEIDTLFWFLNEYVDITQAPPAKGNLREHQLSNTMLLRFIDKVLEKNGLDYWLTYGTLLGGIRHQGHIPWDDDLDIAMPREDYEKAKIIFKELACENGLKFFVNENQFFESIGIGFSDAGLWCDIYPRDVFLFEGSENQAQEVLVERLNNYNRFLASTPCKDWEKLREKQKEVIEGETVPSGISFFYSPFKSFFVKKEDVYPLKKQEFEGFLFNFPQNSDVILTKFYGKDYMSFPRKGILHHSTGEFLDRIEQETRREQLKEMIENI